MSQTSFKRVTGIIAVALIVVLLPGFIFAVFGAEDRAFEDQMQTGIKEANGVLVKEGVCSSLDDCTKKRIIFSLPRSGGFKILSYGIQDQKILGEIAQVFVNKFNETPDMLRLTTVAYAFSYQEGFGIREMREGPIYALELRRPK